MVHRNFLAAASLTGAAALALTAWPAAAHPPMPVCGTGMGMGTVDPTSNIVVQGEGRANVAPDLATVSLGVTTQAPTAAQAMADNAARQTAVIDALRAQGIAPNDLQTQGLNLSPMQDFSREGQPPVITGYQVQNIVTARVRDLGRLGPILDALVAAGATDVQGISFSREDAAQTEDRARTEAVAEARRRAEVIARAAGMELGPIVSLTETSISDGPRPMAMMARAADAEAAKTPVEAGELTLTAQVTGVWSLMPAGGGTDACGPQGHMGFHGHGGPHGHMGSHGHMGPGGHMGPHGHMGSHGPMGPHGHMGAHGAMGPHGQMESQGRDMMGMMPGPDEGMTRPDEGRGPGGPDAPHAPAGQPAPAPAPAPVAPSAAPPAGSAMPQPPGTQGASPGTATPGPAGAAPAGAAGTASGDAAGAGATPAPQPTPPAN